MSVLPSARSVNIVLVMILSFVAGIWVQVNAEAVRRVTNELYEKCVGCAEVKAEAQPAPAQKSCCQKDPSQACGCPDCKGACAGGKGKCPCDPLTCMGKDGCNAWCPGK